jgi:diguanylate cyclase (GGDEF)-like protein
VQRLFNLLRSLGNTLDLVDVLSTFDGELRRLISYDAISVHLVEGARLTPAYAAGPDIAKLLADPETADLLIRTMVERQPAVNEALIFPLENAPLENASAVVAILALYRRCPPYFSDDDLDVLDLLSMKLSASIENARKFQLAAGSVAVDPVTGLGTGRSLFQRLDAEIARSRRSKTQLAVLHCSIEGVDESNRLGSQALEKIATRLRESCREYDFPARSGDDLVLVLPGFGPSDFEEKRRLIERAVEDVGLSAGLPLFATVGAAFYPQDGRDADDLLAESARRLNEAKRVHAGGEHASEHY